MRFGAGGNFDSACAELRDHLDEVVNPVVDHERRVARAEPVAFFFRDVPYREALVPALLSGHFRTAPPKSQLAYRDASGTKLRELRYRFCS